MRRPAGIQLQVVADRVSEGLYDGRIIRVERGPAPWGLRKLAPWEAALNRQPRADWHAYYLIELWRAVGAPGPARGGIGSYRAYVAQLNQQLADWIIRQGRRPRVLHICRYACLKDSADPLPIRSRASKLLRLLDMTRPEGSSAADQPLTFEQPVGWAVTVTVGTKSKDLDSDPLPDTELLRPSIAYKVLKAFPTPPEWSEAEETIARQRVAGSDQQLAVSNQQRMAPDIKGAGS